MQVCDAYRVGADAYRVYLNVYIEGPDAKKARTDPQIESIQSRLNNGLFADQIAKELIYATKIGLKVAASFQQCY